MATAVFEVTMGLLRFTIPDRDRLSESAVQRAYITGLDEVPWPAQIVASESGLIVDRPVGESGAFHILWQVEGVGEVMLATASLMERERPYLLEVELTRGMLNRFRNQMCNWELVGMAVPEPILIKLSEITQKFSRCATAQDDATKACDGTREILGDIFSLTDALGESYSQQALALRHAGGEKLNTMLGGSLGGGPLNEAAAASFIGAFNTALLPLPWRRIEVGEGKYDWALADQQCGWSVANGLKVCSGPLIRFDASDVPDWLYLWEEDADNVVNFVEQYVKSVVLRLKGRVNIWQCASRINAGNFLGFNSQYRMRMAMRIVETVRQLDPYTPALVSFDQPWGEYITQQDMELPIHMADTLIRSNLGLAGVGLEFNLGYFPSGTNRRDVLEFSRQLDRWTLLELPLLISLVVPGGNGDDLKAGSTARPTPDDWTAERQEEWIRNFLPVMLSKTAVQAVIWNQLSDSEPHEFPHGGLYAADSQPKPALTAITSLRQAHLA
ncbi:MAG: hypothetical protein VX988_06740 [Planctomycetota bacterium]|nr:hypothetical protein [Planctomycetota bacterium]